MTKQQEGILNEKKQFLPGSRSEIIHHMVCLTCGAEFDAQCSDADLASVTCTQCGAASLKEKYISFPTDGPGFDENFAKLGLS